MSGFFVAELACFNYHYTSQSRLPANRMFRFRHFDYCSPCWGLAVVTLNSELMWKIVVKLWFCGWSGFPSGRPATLYSVFFVFQVI